MAVIKVRCDDALRMAKSTINRCIEGANAVEASSSRSFMTGNMSNISGASGSWRLHERWFVGRCMGVRIPTQIAAARWLPHQQL